MWREDEPTSLSRSAVLQTWIPTFISCRAVLYVCLKGRCDDENRCGLPHAPHGGTKELCTLHPISKVYVTIGKVKKLKYCLKCCSSLYVIVIFQYICLCLWNALQSNHQETLFTENYFTVLLLECTYLMRYSGTTCVTISSQVRFMIPPREINSQVGI